MGKLRKANNTIETFDELKEYYGEDKELWTIVERTLKLEGHGRTLTDGQKMQIATKIIQRILG